MQEQHPTNENPLTLLREGYLATVPLMIGVAPFGIVFGTLAVNAGMNTLEALGMSIFVIAGSSQFVATGLIGAGAPLLTIVFTTFVINLRHFLYSASLASYLRPLSLPWKLLLGYLMIDEVYAPAMQRKQKGDLSPFELRWYFLGSGLNLASLWWLTTFIGTILGEIMSESTKDLLGFTLPLIFTSIVVPALVTRPLFLSALSAGLAGIIFAPLPNKLGLIVAAAVGITVGVLAESRQPFTTPQEALQ
ncbi:MAG TPA: AzlC family ABC transporter permease [Aggregatilineales bacterium]|nr:AzlC family ABC transporter permease [Aggregatilineales bacterium]